MKKIFAILACVALMCAMPIVAYAEDVSTAPADTEAIVTEEQTTVVEDVTETEPVTETEAVTDAPAELTTEEIVKWVEKHLEEVIVVVSMAVMSVYQAITKLSLNKSVALCNNNAVSVVENSNDVIRYTLSKVEEASASVDRYKEEIVALLTEIRQSDEEKKRLETAFAEVVNYLRTAKLANMELANEVAELLVLANIPNSKKEELYARHRAAVAAIDAVDNAETEVTEDVGEEA